MNIFMTRFQQPAKTAVFVVLDTQKQKREEKGAEKPSQIRSSFGGYKHFELKRNGERVFGNDLMGRTKPAMRIESDEKRETSKDTPFKEQKERPKETSEERRSYEDKFGPDVQPGGFRVNDALRTKPVMRIEEKPTEKEQKTGDKKETPNDTAPAPAPKKETGNERRSHDENADDNFGKGVFRLPSGLYC